MVLVEACVDSVESARAAIAAGAGRLELCDQSVPGGVTPAPDLVAQVLKIASVPVHVLIRPRGGGFELDDAVGTMIRQVGRCKWEGAQGVVIGALTLARGVNQPLTRILRDVARPMAVTFHRAFDRTPRPGVALEVLINLGIERVLTSGTAATAELGIPVLGELVRRARGRISVMAGGGIRGHNAARIVRETGVQEVHASADIPGIVSAVGGL